MKFFSYDSRFGQVMMKVCYACYLNLLWFICSIPVITIGASTTALYSVSLKVIRGEEAYPGRMFFKAFKENFRQATVLWLFLLGAGLFLGLDGYILYHLRASSTGAPAVFWTLVLAIVIAAAVVYVIVLLFIFPLVASVQNTDRAMLINSFLIGTHYLFATIMVFAVHFVMFYIIVRFFTPMIIFGEGACAMVSSYLLNNVLIAVSYNPEEDEEEDEGEDKEREVGEEGKDEGEDDGEDKEREVGEVGEEGKNEGKEGELRR